MNNQGSTTHNEPEDEGIWPRIFIILSYILFVATFPLSLLFCFFVLPEYKRAVLFRLGRLQKHNPRGPGLIFILPCVDDIIRLDLRTVTYDIPPQEVLTKDAVSAKVDGVVYYHLEDPLKAVLTVANYVSATQLLAQTTLRNALGTKSLAEILAEKEQIAKGMQVLLDAATDPWGVKVERVEIQEVRLPALLQRAMAAEAEASREARAKVLVAEGELKASEALQQASETLSKTPIALQLRYLQTLNQISATNNSTVIFPFPMEFLSMLKK